MTGARAQSFASFKENIGVDVELVTTATILTYQVTGHPFHPAAVYSLSGIGNSQPTGMSAVHIVDYLRAYFMYHYGGGYHDVKGHLKKNSWSASFDEFSDPNVWVKGVRESPGGLGCKEQWFSGVPQCYTWRLAKKSCCGQVRGIADKFAIINGAYIMRPKTRLTYEWLRNVECNLSVKFEAIKMHPAPTHRCCLSDRKTDSIPMLLAEWLYPIGWTELHGDALGPLEYKFREHMQMDLPPWSWDEEYISTSAEIVEHNDWVPIFSTMKITMPFLLLLALSLVINAWMCCRKISKNDRFHGVPTTPAACEQEEAEEKINML